MDDSQNWQTCSDLDWCPECEDFTLQVQEDRDDPHTREEVCYRCGKYREWTRTDGQLTAGDREILRRCWEGDEDDALSPSRKRVRRRHPRQTPPEEHIL